MSKPGAFDDATRAAVLGATFGRCARCKGVASQAHHRSPRGMGGTSNSQIGQACNGIPFCAGCHGWVESNRETARDEYGWLVPDISDAASVPWWCAPWGSWLRWVDDDGTWLVELVDLAWPVGVK